MKLKNVNFEITIGRPNLTTLRNLTNNYRVESNITIFELNLRVDLVQIVFCSNKDNYYLKYKIIKWETAF
jgi:hypothetical protein